MNSSVLSGSLLPLCLLTAFFAARAEDESLTQTLMTTRGKLLASENFDQPLPPFTGKPVGIASGFLGWRYNAQPTNGKSGRWELVDGTFRGIESPGANHPATASFGIPYQNAIIQCDVRLDDARGDADDVERGQRERERMGQGERGDDLHRVAQLSAHDEQPEQEGEMIPAGDDVLDPEQQELAPG